MLDQSARQSETVIPLANKDSRIQMMMRRNDSQNTQNSSHYDSNARIVGSSSQRQNEDSEAIKEETSEDSVDLSDEEFESHSPGNGKMSPSSRDKAAAAQVGNR